MRRLFATLGLALLASAAGAVSPAAAQEPIRIGTLGGVFSTLWAVNNKGAAVGWSDVTWTDSEHAILWQDGQLIDPGALPGDTVSRAFGINDLGQVVGLSVNNDGLSRIVRPVLWQQGQAIELPGGEGCAATAINNLGHFGFRCGAWIWRDGERVNLGVLPGYGRADIAALNDADVAVGTMYNNTGGSTAFKWKNGVLTDLGALARGTRSAATAVNARGQVAGYVGSGAVDDSEPVIWHRHTVTPLGGRWGVFRGRAWGINDRGDVVGSGYFVDGSGSGPFVWSRGRFRFLNPYFVLSDINERRTVVGRDTELGTTAQGVVVPRAGWRGAVPLPPDAPLP